MERQRQADRKIQRKAERHTQRQRRRERPKHRDVKKGQEREREVVRFSVFGKTDWTLPGLKEVGGLLSLLLRFWGR